jgi:hypothetical protein
MINLDYIENETSRAKAEAEINQLIEVAKDKKYKYLAIDVETEDLVDADYKLNYVQFNDEICFEKFIKYDFAIYNLEEGIWC